MQTTPQACPQQMAPGTILQSHGSHLMAARPCMTTVARWVNMLMFNFMQH